MAGRADFFAPAAASAPDALGTIFAVRVSRDDILLISGDEQLLLSVSGAGEGTAPHLTAAAATVRRARARTLRRCLGRDAFLLLSERLSRAQSAGEVLDGVLEHLPSVVDGFVAAVALRLTGSGAAALQWRLPPVAAEGDPAHRTTISAGAMARLSISGVLIREDCAEDESLRGIAELMASTEVSKLAFAGLGKFGTLFLLERRPDREFEADDWHLLSVVARQAENALTRLRGSPA